MHWLGGWPAALPGDPLVSALPVGIAAFVAGLAAVLALGPVAIRIFARLGTEPVHSPSPAVRERQRAKAGTPTLGGLLIAGGWLIAATILWGLGLTAPGPLVLAGITTGGLMAVGLVDDLAKLRRHGAGLAPRTKLLGQVASALPAAIGLAFDPAARQLGASLGWLHDCGPGLTALWSLWVIVGAANAVNLADGLDGLAAGTWLIAAGGLIAAGFVELAHGGELAPAHQNWLPLAAGLAGAVAGFLWWNRFPARLFMGDTGALGLGGFLGLWSLATGASLLLAVVGAVFVSEVLSVLVQRLARRVTGRKPFRCAPWHHHFQLLGIPETRVVRGFWLAGCLAAVVGVGTQLGLRGPASPPGSVGDGGQTTQAGQTSPSSAARFAGFKMPVWPTNELGGVPSARTTSGRGSSYLTQDRDSAVGRAPAASVVRVARPADAPGRGMQVLR